MMIRVKSFSNSKGGNVIPTYFMTVDEEGIPFGSRYQSEEAAQKQADKLNERR